MPLVTCVRSLPELSQMTNGNRGPRLPSAAGATVTVRGSAYGP